MNNHSSDITQSYTIQCNSNINPPCLVPLTTPIPPHASSSAQPVAPFPSVSSILSIKQYPACAHHGDRVCRVQNLQRKERAMAEACPASTGTTFILH